MALSDVGLVRQYDFKGGPNYTDSPFHLADNELSETLNMYEDGGLVTIPGASSITGGTNIGGASPVVTSIYQYQKSDGTDHLLATTDDGYLVRYNAGTFTNIVTTTGGLTATQAPTDWTTFNDLAILVNGTDEKKWDGTTLADLSGSPPAGKTIWNHGDYVMIAGHDGDKLRYSDTVDPETWPAGNELRVGVDSGEDFVAGRAFGEVSYLFMEHSIWVLEGRTPLTFSIYRTPAHLSTLSIYAAELTPYGFLCWTRSGPGLFDGTRMHELAPRLRTLIDDVDWTPANTQFFWIRYYPHRQQALFTYVRASTSEIDSCLLLDCTTLRGRNPVFWPIQWNSASRPLTAGRGLDVTTGGRQRVYLGTRDGHLLKWDDGLTYNGNQITPRARTRIFHLGSPDRRMGIRTMDGWFGATSTKIDFRYSVDGTQTFTTHTQANGLSLANSGKDLKYVQLSGDGTGVTPTANVVQLEITTNGTTTGLTIHGLEVGVNDLSRRRV